MRVGRTGYPTRRQRSDPRRPRSSVDYRRHAETGRVLAGRDMDAAHPPASTIKTLLALTALDELPSLDATVVGTEADTHAECNCAKGIKAGRPPAARQLLDAVVADIGKRRGQCACRHDRRLRHTRSRR